MSYIHRTSFIAGHDCIHFPCKFDKKCTPGNSHGVHGLTIFFYVHNDVNFKGVVQFMLYTGWPPRRHNAGFPFGKESSLVMPADLGYHSLKPMYNGQLGRDDCHLLIPHKCYYDGSGLNAVDAYNTLVNGGEEALWKFMEQYYECIFNDAPYPSVFRYPTDVAP